MTDSHFRPRGSARGVRFGGAATIAPSQSTRPPPPWSRPTKGSLDLGPEHAIVTLDEERTE